MQNEGCHSMNGETREGGCVSPWRVGLMVASVLLALEGTSLAVGKHDTSLSPDLPGLEEGQTGSAQEAPVTVHQALQAQTQRVDQQIADFESHFVRSKNILLPDSSPTDAGTLEESASKVPQGESRNLTGEDVQILDETVVRDTYLDPFDEDSQEEAVEDPWESMNTRMFSFNMQADHYVLKPFAMGYAWVLPDPVERAIGRAIHNIRFVPRTMNNLFQQKWGGASVETGRFVINSTVGIGGLFDVAGSQLGMMPASPEDLGQTLAVYGVRSGPYLVLPFLPPTTVRDGAGLVGDILLDPLSYFLPFIPGASLKTNEIVNDRSQNLELFEGVETSTVDLYGAVRTGYMQRRSQAIKE